jgi:hypothetical protein
MIQGWSRTALLLGALAAPGDEAPSGAVRRVQVPLPAGWRDAARLVLMLEGVATPRGQAFVVRVKAAARQGPDELLGSVGVLAREPGAPGMRPPATYRVDVTRGLRRWAESHPGAKTVTLVLATRAAGEEPVAVDWRVERAAIVARAASASPPP